LASLIEKIQGLYGTRLYHWSRRITQAEDLMRRGHRIFPNAIKRPYRHLHYIAIVIRDSPEWDELKRWLDERQIEWREQRDPENDPYSTYGYTDSHPTELATQLAPNTAESAARMSGVDREALERWQASQLQAKIDRERRIESFERIIADPSR
jgi:hypothetical protein